MGISNVTEAPKVSAPPAPPVASAPTQAPASATPAQDEEAVTPIETPPPPPPQPVQGYDIEVAVGEHAATGHRVYGFFEPDSGELLVQIPNESVLNLVAQIVAKLEAEGRA